MGRIIGRIITVGILIIMGIIIFQRISGGCGALLP
jgi:hypothetical protein